MVRGLFRLGLAVVLALVLVAGLEGVARLLHGAPAPAVVTEESGWLEYSAGLGWRARVPRHAEDERRGRRRVLLVGDSRTWGNGVDPDQTFGAVLERRLPELQVVNRAVPGYSSLQGRLALEADAPRVRPEIVVFAFGFNDRRYALRAGDADGADRFRRLYLGSLWTRFMGSLALVELAGGGRSRLAGEVGHPLDLGTVRPRVSAGAFRANLEAVARYASAHGIHLVFLLLRDNPRQSADLDAGAAAVRAGRDGEAERHLVAAVALGNAFSDAARLRLAEVYERTHRAGDARAVRVSPRTFYSATGGYPISPDAEYEAIARDVAASTGVRLADAGALLARHPDTYFDFCHFNGEGHRLVADLLAAELAPLARSGNPSR